MATTRWKAIAENLRSKQDETPAHATLRRVQQHKCGLAELEREILTEMSEALVRANEKVSKAIEAINLQLAFVEKLKSANDTRSDLQLRKAEERLFKRRAEAQQALWELIVHREAVGFRNHDAVREQYVIP